MRVLAEIWLWLSGLLSDNNLILKLYCSKQRDISYQNSSCCDISYELDFEIHKCHRVWNGNTLINKGIGLLCQTTYRCNIILEKSRFTNCSDLQVVSVWPARWIAIQGHGHLGRGSGVTLIPDDIDRWPLSSCT